MKLNKFREDVGCPQCGAFIHMVKNHYHAYSNDDLQVPFTSICKLHPICDELDGDRDHIHRKCLRCEYEWIELPKDYQI